MAKVPMAAAAAAGMMISTFDSSSQQESTSATWAVAVAIADPWNAAALRSFETCRRNAMLGRAAKCGGDRRAFAAAA
jgi:hypothetical protein